MREPVTDTPTIRLPTQEDSAVLTGETGICMSIFGEDDTVATPLEEAWAGTASEGAVDTA